MGNKQSKKKAFEKSDLLFARIRVPTCSPLRPPWPAKLHAMESLYGSDDEPEEEDKATSW